nr:hypothetical protein [Janthinobacterium sp. HH104]
MLAPFFVGHQVELVDFQPGDQGHHIALVGEDQQAVMVALQGGDGGGHTRQGSFDTVRITAPSRPSPHIDKKA